MAETIGFENAQGNLTPNLASTVVSRLAAR